MGREIDKQIAEKMMSHIDFFDSKREVKGIPNYSTDIAAAWEVVEKLAEVCRVFIEIDDGIYYVRIEYQETSMSVAKYFEAEDESAPMAICRAALKLMEDK